MLKSLQFPLHSTQFSSLKPYPHLNFPQLPPRLNTPNPSILPLRAKSKTKELILTNPINPVQKGKYSYTVETLINNLSSISPRGSVARCLEPFKNRASINDFVLVFKEFAARGDWHRALRLFKYMQRQVWCRPNEMIYAIMIGVLGREGLLEKCMDVFESMPAHNVARTVYSFTALVNAFGRNGKHETAIELLGRMKKERVIPSVLTYNSVINACVRGGLDWEGLLGLFAEMRHDGVQPDIVTYNTLLSACASRLLGDEAEMVFRKMNESGVLPDITTHNLVVETFGKLGRLEKVSELLEEMATTGNMPDASSYNVLLEAHAKEGSIPKAINVFGEMQGAGCTPNAATYSILLNLYGKQGRYDEARELFLDMKVSNTEPDVSTYNVLIQVFGEGGYFKEVVTLFHDMLDEKVEPNMQTYEALTVSCGKGGLHGDAKKILLHMNKKGIVPSPKAYTGIIEAYGQAALYEEAVVTFNTMNEMGSNPSVETFNCLINTYARGGMYKESEAVVRRMSEFSFERNRDSFNGVIEGFRQGGRYEEAIQAYVEMKNARCGPDERTLEAVLSVYCFAGLVEESEENFQEIKNLGISPSIICYSMMLAVYAKNEQLDNAYSLLEEMVHTKKSNVVQAIGQLIQGDFDDESNWQIVDYVFDQINAQGCGFGMRFYNSLLEALWWLGQKARAARVLNEAFKRGLFPELFRKNKLLWSLDVHRMWPGSTSTAISIWLNDLYREFKDRTDLPHVTSVVLSHGKMERDSAVQESPIAKAVLSFLKTNLPPSSFTFSGWNEGRLICQRKQLRELLTALKESSVVSDKGKIITLSNSPLPLSATVGSSYPNGRRDRPSAFDSDGTKTILTGTETELLPSVA
ncbi:hypothetical protein Drorol1_Dr00021205 [Drosera rotundifolia]